MKKFVSMKDIADRVGISRPTVSFALNDRYDGVGISEELRQKIKKTAAEMGYRRNGVVQSLLTNRTKQIALLLNVNIKHEYTYRVLHAAIGELSAAGYTARIFHDNTESNLEETMEEVFAQRIEGIITIQKNISVFKQILEMGRKQDIPVLDFYLEKTLDQGIFVGNDNAAGIEEAVKSLKEQGHKHIGIMGLTDVNSLRNQIYLQSMRKFGIKNKPEDNSYAGRNIEHQANARRLLSRPANKRPTAYLCGTDYIAVVMIMQAALLGLKVPQDLSVVGFGGLNVVSHIYPDLSTVVQPFEEEGVAAARELIAEIERPRCKSFNKSIIVKLKTKFVDKGSTSRVG